MKDYIQRQIAIAAKQSALSINRFIMDTLIQRLT